MPNTLKQSGIVESFNVSPKGDYEGLLVTEGEETIQVNFPRHLASAITEIVKVGAAVRLGVEERPTDRPQAHPVFELVTLQGKTIKQLEKNDHALNKGLGFSGTVAKLNYALHGEVNGAILNTGDFLHLKPHGAKAVRLRLGMKVKGEGRRKPMVGGKSVIEASEVNGIQIEGKPKPKKHS